MRNAAGHPNEWIDFLTALGLLVTVGAVAFIARGWNLNRMERRREAEGAETIRRRYQPGRIPR